MQYYQTKIGKVPAADDTSMRVADLSLSSDIGRIIKQSSNTPSAFVDTNNNTTEHIIPVSHVSLIFQNILTSIHFFCKSLKNEHDKVI
jgi:hypothetical protein